MISGSSGAEWVFPHGDVEALAARLRACVADRPGDLEPVALHRPETAFAPLLSRLAGG